MLEETKRFAKVIIETPGFSPGVKADWQHVLDLIAAEEKKEKKKT